MGQHPKLMRSAAQTAVFMAILTFISKCFGFVREMIMANYFGASYVTDAYVMATAIPSIIFGGIFAAIGNAYMPIFSEKIEKQGIQAGNRFTSEVLSLAIIIAAIISIFSMFFSDQIVAVFASGFHGETAQLTSSYIKVTFTILIFTSVLGVLESYLQYNGVFLIQIIVSYFYNIVIIITIVIAAYTNNYLLVFGWFFAYLVKLPMVFQASRKKGLSFQFTFHFGDSAKNIIMLAVPVFISTSIIQINAFIDKSLASGLPEGSVSALNYGMLLINLITGMTVMILSTILYPKMNQFSATDNYIKFGETLSTGVNLIVIIAAPCSLGAMLYSSQIVRIVYERGMFDSHATSMTASAFLFFAAGILFMSMNEIMTKAFYSLHNMRSPMICSAVSMAVNVTLNLLLIRSMGINGLALSTSVAALVCTVMMLALMKKRYSHVKIYEGQKIVKIFSAAVISIMASYLLYRFVILDFGLLGHQNIIQLFLAVSAAVVVYLLLLYWLKIEEIKLIKQIFRR